jgi:hypothetical protein
MNCRMYHLLLSYPTLFYTPPLFTPHLSIPTLIHRSPSSSVTPHTVPPSKPHLFSSPPPFPQLLPPFLGHIQCSFHIACARELSFIPQERVERPTFDLEATWEVAYFVRVRGDECCEEYGVSRMSGFYLRCLTAKYGVRVDNGR